MSCRFRFNPVQKNIFLKAFLVTLLVMVYSATSFAQLSASAVHTAKWCAGRVFPPPPGPHIGGQPAAIGGVPPYKYKWTCISTYPNLPCLDNDTIANPQVITWSWGAYHSLTYQLTVTDSIGNTANDTANIYVGGQFSYSLTPCEYDKGTNDTVTLIPTITGGSYGYAPIAYYWTPNLYLSSDSMQYPISWATADISYTVHAIDSIGCSDSAITPCDVYVYSERVSHEQLQSTHVRIFPNPLCNKSIITISNELIGGSLYCFDIQGRLLRTITLTSTTVGFGNQDIQDHGLLYYRILDKSNRFVTSGTVINE